MQKDVKKTVEEASLRAKRSSPNSPENIPRGKKNAILLGKKARLTTKDNDAAAWKEME